MSQQGHKGYDKESVWMQRRAPESGRGTASPLHRFNLQDLVGFTEARRHGPRCLPKLPTAFLGVGRAMRQGGQAAGIGTKERPLRGEERLNAARGLLAID